MCILCDKHNNHKKKYFRDIIPEKGILIKNFKLFKKLYIYLIMILKK